MQQYVLSFIEWNNSVLLIEKKRPDWQAGRFNLVGGHVEEGETLHEAADRELLEESGLVATESTLMGTIQADNAVVYIFQHSVEVDHSNLRFGHPKLEQNGDEAVFWMPIAEALKDTRLMDNLRFMIPMLHCGLNGWTIYDGPWLPDNQFVIALETADAPAQVA